MKEKLMKRFYQKLHDLFNSNNVTMHVISYRYGELVGMLNIMSEINMINSNQYSVLISIVEHLCTKQMKISINRKFGVGEIK